MIIALSIIVGLLVAFVLVMVVLITIDDIKHHRSGR